MTRQVVCLFAVITTLLLFGVQNSFSWTDPEYLTGSDSGRNLNPAIATDRAGTYGITWLRDGQVLFSRSTDNAATWSSPVPLASTVAPPVIAAVESDWTVAWSHSDASTSPSIWIRKSADAGASWSDPILVVGGGFSSNLISLQIAVNDANTWMIVWNAQGSPTQTFMSRSVGGTAWSAPVELPIGFAPSIACDGGQTWIVGSASMMRRVTSTDGGVTWGEYEPFELADPPYWGFSPKRFAIQADRHGNWTAILDGATWIDRINRFPTSCVFNSTDNGATWSNGWPTTSSGSLDGWTQIKTLGEGFWALRGSTDEAYLDYSEAGACWDRINQLPLGPLPIGSGMTSLALGDDQQAVAVWSIDGPSSSTIAVSRTSISLTSYADLVITGYISGNPASVPENHPVEYVITATNTGMTTATNVVLSDLLPSGVTFVSATSTTGIVAESTGTVTANVGDLAPGASVELRVLVVTDPVDWGTVDPMNVASCSRIDNTAKVTSDNDPFECNNSTELPVDKCKTAEVELIITEEYGDPITLGEGGTANVSYYFTVKNNGPSRVRGFSIDYQTTGAGAPVGSGTLPLQWMYVEPGQTRSAMGISFSVTSPGTVEVTASIRMQEYDADLSNNTVVEHTEIIETADLGLSVTESRDPVVVGRALTYRFEIDNQGLGVAHNATVQYQLSGSMTQTGELEIGTLAANTTAVAELTVTPDTEGSLTLVASVSSDPSDPDPSDNTVVEHTAVIETADLGLSVIESRDPVIVGRALTYRFEIDNQGLGVAHNAVVQYQLSGSMTQTGELELGTLAANTTAVGELTVTPDTEGSLTLVASALSDLLDPTPENNSVTEETAVVPLDGPDLMAEWSDVSVTTKTTRRRTTYRLNATLVVRNVGNATANRFVAETKVAGTSSTAVLLNQKIGRLRPGQSKRMVIRKSLYVPSTGLELAATLDSRQSVLEADETNNTARYGPLP